MNRLLKKKGLSIIEIIIVSAIVPLVGMAIYSTFNSGIKIYQRINKNLPLEDINLFLNDFYQDLRNTFKFNGIAFQGEEERFQIPLLVYDPVFKTNIPGKVVYLYQPEKKRLLRQEFSLVGIYSLGKETKTETLENIHNLKFQYYYYHKDKNAYIWQDNDLYGKIPLAIRIEFEWINTTQTPKQFVYNVFIPIAE